MQVVAGIFPQENTMRTDNNIIILTREDPAAFQRIADKLHAAINPETMNWPTCTAPW